jgi:S1-C subfamily serine protease
MADRAEVERRAFEQHFGPQSGNLPGGQNGGQAPQAPASNATDEGAAAGSVAQAAPAAPPAHYSKSFLGSLLTSPTYTGVLLERLGPQLSSFFGVPSGGGLLVRNVENNSPAAMAGIHAGDVVLRANSQNVASMNDWAKAIKEAKGRPVPVVIFRDRQEKTVVLTPDSKKRSDLEFPPGQDDDFVVARLALLTRF